MKNSVIFAALFCVTVSIWLGSFRAPESPAVAWSLSVLVDGEKIYQNQCAECHGSDGQGIGSERENALVGDLSIKELAKIIHETMPEDDPDACTGKDAEAVARYIHGTFYSPDARAKNETARIELSRLTAQQYRLSTTDLIASFRPAANHIVTPGLKAEYFTKLGINYTYRLSQKTFERVDNKIDFDFGQSGPQPMARQVKDFGIRWHGSILAERSGDYEFALITQNGARLWINDSEIPLIDGWVESHKEPKRYEGSIRLIAGRRFAFRLEFHTYQEPNASIQLLWKQPEGVWEVVPPRVLSQESMAELFVGSTELPADDSSAGFARGTDISKMWDEATTRSGIELMRYVVEHLDELAGTSAKDSERANKVKVFCKQFAERAFRRPLTDQQNAVFVEQHFQKGMRIEDSVKRSILLALKSPRFLYPALGHPDHDSFAIATSLALTLWDSIPDQPLIEAANSGELGNRDQLLAQARRMMNDPRAVQKLKSFLHEWIKLEDCSDVSKDSSLFPQFNATLVNDLRISLELQLAHAVDRRGSDYRNLLTANEIYVNQPIAKFYGVQGSRPAKFEKVKLDQQRMAGVLTHPLLLATHAYHRSTSPIHRGVFLSQQVLGRSLKQPLDEIEFDESQFKPGMTMREKVTQMTKPVACQACHQIINPVGFAMENFDTVGRFRTKANKKPIDSKVKLPMPDGREIELNNARDLAEFAAKDPLSQRGFVEQMFQYAAKQAPAAYGADTVGTLHESFTKTRFNMKKLFVEIAVTASQR